MEEEIWKSVKNYEGLYEVSNFGNIRSIDRYVQRSPTSTFQSLRKAIPRKLTFNADGYYQVRLSKNGKAKSEPVHKLVATTFIPNPDNLPEINHIKPPKTNNRVDNLEWCTGKQNKEHQHSTMNIKYNAGNVLTIEQVKSIREERRNDATIQSLVNKYGVVRTSIKNVLSYKTYKDV